MTGRSADVETALALLGNFARFVAKTDPNLGMRLLSVTHEWARELGMPSDKLNEALVEEKPLLVAQVITALRKGDT